jgi:hypothetical protein
MTERLNLPYPGTEVTAIVGSYIVYGVVEDYEHHSPNQTTFPVRFGSRTRLMTAAEVTVLPDDQQPPDRRPPRWTGCDTDR